MIEKLFVALAVAGAILFPLTLIVVIPTAIACSEPNPAWVKPCTMLHLR